MASSVKNGGVQVLHDTLFGFITIVIVMSIWLLLVLYFYRYSPLRRRLLVGL